MEDNYILIRKSDNGVALGLKKEVKEIFDEIFDECRDNKVFFDDGNCIDYKLSNKDSNLLYLKVTSDLSEMKNAELLDRFYCDLTKGNHRKNYYIVRAYSQSSLTYCCKLMKYFGEFERRLRELLYLAVIKTYGENWFEETFEKELSDDVKSRIGANKKQIIESALEELTYEQLIRYIFEPQNSKELEAFIEEIKDDTFFELPQEEIYDKIRSIRKLSLWEKLFADRKDLEDLKEYIEELRPLRNNTMHHKSITNKDFLLSRKKLKFVNEKLKNAVGEIENRNFSEYKLDYLTALKSVLIPIMIDVLPTIVAGFKEFRDKVILPIKENLNKLNLQPFLTSLALESNVSNNNLLLERANEDKELDAEEENDNEEKEKQQ